MKRTLLPLFLCSGISISPAAILQFDLSPPGTDAAVGLSSANEAPPVAGSTGTGNEIIGGITLNTDTSTLSFNIGYGSASGFNDLTGPATLAHIHGPASTGVAAGVLIDLASFHVPAPDPASGGVISGSVVLTAANVSNLLSGLLYVNVHTALNPAGEIRGQLIQVTNNTPRITCPPPVTVECSSSNGAFATVEVVVADEDDEPLQVSWVVDGISVRTDLVAGTTATNNTVSFAAEFGLGSHDVVVSVTDGNTVVTCSTTVEVVDTTPPTIVGITATPNRLWPPNHKMVPVRVDVFATDLCGPVVCRVTGVTSDQPINGLGDGNTSPDWIIDGDLRVRIRAERSGKIKQGRTYTIAVECSDPSGNASTGNVTVFVPHDQRGHKPGKDWQVSKHPPKKAKKPKKHGKN